MQLNPFAIPTLLSALLGWGLTVYVARQREAAVQRPLALLLLAISWWATFSTLELVSRDVAALMLFSKLQYLGIVLIPVAWVAFAFSYAGKALPPRFETALIPALITLLTVWAYPTLRWVWTDVRAVPVGDFVFGEYGHGPGFWIHIAYTYSFLVWGTVVMMRALLVSRALFRGQGAVILVAILLPWLGNAMYIFRLSPFPYYDYTPVVFVFSAALLVWGNYAFRLLDVVPVARDVVMDSIADAVVVLDLEGRIVDANPVALGLLERPLTQLVGKTLVELYPQYAELLAHYRTHLEAHDELSLELGGKKRIFDLRLSPVYDNRKLLRGRVVVLRDITDRKRLEASLTAQINLFENLLEVVRAASAQPALEETLRNTLDIAVRLTRSERGSILLVNAQGMVTHHILARGDLPAYASREIVNQVLQEGFAGWLLRYGEVALLEDTDQDSRWLTLPNQPYQVRSVLGVPIKYLDQILGVMVLMHGEPHHYTARDVEVMRAAAQQMALTVRNAQFYYAEQRMAERQTVLFEVLRSAQESLTGLQAARRMLRMLVQLTGWPLVALMEPEMEKTWRVALWEGRLTPPLDWRLHVDNVATEQGRQCALGDATELPGFPEARSFIAAPIRFGEQVFRGLLIVSDQPFAFGDDDRMLIPPLVDVMALVMRNAELFEQVQLNQRRLDALIQSSTDGIVMLGMDRRVLVVNQRALDYLGLEGLTPASWIGRPVEEVFRPLWRTAPHVVRVLIQELRRVREGDESPAEGEYEIAGRTLVWANLPVLDEAGEALGRLIVLRDVTPIRQAERLREDLIHTMVHDLRNPLTAVRGAIQLLQGRSREWNRSDAQLLDLAYQGSARMLDLVNAILDVGRLESGRMPLNLQATSLASLVADVLVLQEPLAVQKGVRLLQAIPAELPPVYVDPALITRVLQNLVGNALKFTPSGGLVEVSARLLAQPRAVEVRVRDTGPGIPPELKARLFGKFVTGNVEGRGSGLGLAFCKLTLEAHGQSIRVESQPGQGSTFIFTLPLAEEA